MAASTGTDLNTIVVEISSQMGTKKVVLNNISPSTTIGQLKTQLNVRPNSRFGRQQQFENWDNRRSLADYFVRNGEVFSCVIQCIIEDGQSHFDDYQEWLAANKTQ